MTTGKTIALTRWTFVGTVIKMHIPLILSYCETEQSFLKVINSQLCSHLRGLLKPVSSAWSQTQSQNAGLGHDSESQVRSPLARMTTEVLSDLETVTLPTPHVSTDTSSFSWVKLVPLYHWTSLEIGFMCVVRGARMSRLLGKVKPSSVRSTSEL